MAEPDRPTATAEVAEARLRGLVRIAGVLSEVRGYDDVLRRSAEAARSALRASRVSLSRYEAERGVIRTLVRAGELRPGEETLPAADIYPVSDYPILLDLFESQRGTVVTLEPGGGPAVEQALLRTLGAHSALLVPILLEGRAWGELYAVRRREDPAFTADDLDYGGAVAAHIAAGIVQADHLEQVNRLAYADPLTGLANRRALDERLEAAMERHRRDGRPVGVVLADLNRLKDVNDEAGHESGDRLLRAVAGVIGAAAGTLPGSIAARVGGDEFCVVVEDYPPDAVVAMAGRLAREAARLPSGYGVSVGVASTGDPVGQADTPRRLLRLADAAQYRAKRGGTAEPVVAGRRLPPAAAAALPAVPEIEPGVPERRRVFPRSVADPAAVLTAGVEALDEAAAGPAGRDVAARLEIAAGAVAQRLDAAGWTVSRVPPGGDRLVTLTWSLRRTTSGRAPAAPPGPVGEVALAVRPHSAAAVRGGGYAFEPGAPDNDPAEDALLVAGGYTGTVAAGVTTTAGGWLVELFTDAISARVEGLVPVLRALVVLAAHPPVGDTLAGPEDRASTPR